MEDSKKIILVTGATGNQGGAVARHLLKRGKFKVRALVRDKNKPAAQKLGQAGAELAEGNFDDRASLERAMQGVYGVFSVQGIENGLDVEIKQGKTVADAAAAAGVKHFVYSSVGSADQNTGIPHFDSKFQIEEYIRAVNLPYTILRPVFFLFNYNHPQFRGMIEGGTLFQPLSPDTKLQQISEDDYGEMVAEVFERREEFLNQAIDAASVEMTMPEVAAAFSNVLGKKIEYQQIPLSAFGEQGGEEMTKMYDWFERTGYRANLPELREKFGHLTDLETYLRSHGWGKSSESAHAAE